MLILKMKQSKKKEKGIALVFTLIMLSLMLILALGFALNSMFDQKAAHNAANVSSGGLLAQTQLKQVLSLIKHDEANLDASRFTSHDSGSPAVTDTNMLKDMLQERLTVPDLLSTIDTDKVNWNYIRSQDSEQRIIGRTAFVAIAGGIPLNSIISSTYNETLNTENRIGKNISEINVNAVISGATTAMINVFNWAENKPVSGEGFTGGCYTGNWSGYDAIFSAIEAVPTTLTPAQEGEIQNNLSICNAKDKEAFWADTSVDTIIDSNELYKRFDLTRDWNSADHAGDLDFIQRKILLDPGVTGAPTEDMETWNEADSTVSSAGFPWLACFGYKNTGMPYTLTELSSTFPSIFAHRNQIAANLKDYCDDDGTAPRPTSDVDPATWLTSANPTFTGNERTPYIDKIGIRVESDLTNTATHTVITVSVKPYVGLVDIYESIYPSAVYAVVHGTVSAKVSFNGGSDIAFTDFTIDSSPITITSWAVSTAGHSSFVEGTASSPPQSKSVAVLNAFAKVTVTNVTITKIVLYANTNDGYDYVKTLTYSPAGGFEAFQNSNTVNSTEIAWLGFEVNDPRQNLNAGDWVTLTPQHSVNTCFAVSAAYECDPNAGNLNLVVGTVPRVSPDAGGASYDLETTTDPANGLSTAFIRNAPMESPWELGFIHRGVRWQTINLKAYDAARAYQITKIPASTGKDYILGGGLYSSGDSNILDQIKMTAKAKSPQKINLKLQKTTTFDALFYKINLKPTIDATMSVTSMAGGDNTNMAAESSAITANIIAKFGDDVTYLPATKRTRASIADKLKLPIGTIPAVTDADQEELIGKLINLTKVNGKVDGFTIVILAQMIKDIGTSAGITIHKYSDDETPGNRLCKISVFDADINDINDSKKNIYYDEITAEQKIIVKGYRTIDGNIKITSFQYVD